MKLEWNNEQLLADGKPLHRFDYPIDGALAHKGVIVVLLDGPKASRNTHPELVDEMNRNVYGLNPDGSVKWRIKSHGSDQPDSMYFENSFAYLAIFVDTFILYDGERAKMTLDVQTGETEYLPLPKLRELVDEAKRTNQMISSPDTRGPVFANEPR